VQGLPALSSWYRVSHEACSLCLSLLLREGCHMGLAVVVRGMLREASSWLWRQGLGRRPHCCGRAIAQGLVIIVEGVLHKASSRSRGECHTRSACIVVLIMEGRVSHEACLLCCSCPCRRALVWASLSSQISHHMGLHCRHCGAIVAGWQTRP